MPAAWPACWARSLGLLAVAGGAAHFFPSGSSRTVAVSAFSSYLLALAPVSLVLLALARRWVVAVLAAAVVFGAVALVGPTYVGSAAKTGGPALTVLTANVKLGEADADGVVTAARSADADVLLLQELTPAPARPAQGGRSRPGVPSLAGRGAPRCRRCRAVEPVPADRRRAP